MSVAALPHPFAGLTDVGELLAFPTAPSENAQKNLTREADSLIRGVGSVLDQLIFSVIEKRTAKEFASAREHLFPKYFFGVRAVSDLARIVVPQSTIEILTDQYFTEMESDFSSKGTAAFGTAVRDQALFTVWTMRKITALCQRINRAKVPNGLTKDDKKMSSEFAYYAIYTRFHVHCLETSMRLEKPLYPEVLDEAIDGLRAVVNAYALARRGLDLRCPSSATLLPPVEWDEEEQQLLDEATHDLLNEID